MWRSLFLAFVLGVYVPATMPVKAQAAAESDCVILLHGLGRTHRSMKPIQKHLRNRGYHVVNKGYHSRAETIPGLAKSAVETAVMSCPLDRTIHVVTHSMGGILLRQYLAKDKLPRLRNVVMLSPPNQGSEVIDELGEWPVYKQVLGPAGRQLGTDGYVRELPSADFSLGIIAGNRSVNPILSMMFEGDNDGKVSVESSKLSGMSDHLVMPVNHTFMMRDKEVLEQIVHFLEFKRFK